MDSNTRYFSGHAYGYEVGRANGQADALGSLVVIKGMVDLEIEISTSIPEAAYAYSIKDKNGDPRGKG